MSAMPQAAWDLAARAADRIVGRAAAGAVVRGVLAQWVAEHGYQWPFSRNNPGNVARNWAAAFAYPFTVELPNPQPGNPIVTFPTQAVGADVYAAGLIKFDRYNGAVVLARAGDGLGFAVEVSRAGYGTRESAIRSVYAELVAPGSPRPGPRPGGDNVAIRWSQVGTTATQMRLPAHQALYEWPGGPQVTAMSRAATVPHVGLAGSAGGRDWRAVEVGTSWSYSDGDPHPTVLYVPADAGEVVKT